MRRYIKRFSIVLALVIASLNMYGQYNQTQYFMGIPQANMVNPAFRPSTNVYVGIPALSGIYFSMNNNMLSLSQIFQPLAGTDSLMTILHPDYNRDAFLNRLGNTGYISADASIQILGLGFTIQDNWFVDLSLSQKASASAYLPGDLITLLLEGNEGFLGSSVDLTRLGFEAMQYMESSVGVSRNIGDKLRVGGKFKLLFGGVGASLKSDRLELDVNQDFSHTLHSDISLNLSGPFTVTIDEDGLIEDIVMDKDINPMDILLNTGNSGVAFDLGAEYKILNNLSVSASIIDLGFVGWKTNTFNFKANNNFSFDGFDLTQVIDGDLTFDEMLENFGDSLKNSFVLTDSEERFGTGLPTKVFLGANYRPIKYFGVGLLSRSTINQGHFSQALSLSANLYAADILSASLVYTMANKTYSNLGFGLAVRSGPVQFYTIVDQIPLTWDKITFPEAEKAVSLPDRLDYINLRFGINLVFGKAKEKKSDTPMLLEN
jgi:hypothetical protein